MGPAAAVRLSELDREELGWLAGREDLELAAAPSGKPRIVRHIAVTETLLRLLGRSTTSTPQPVIGNHPRGR